MSLQIALRRFAYVKIAIMIVSGIILGTLIQSHFQKDSPSNSDNTNKLCIARTCITIEKALTPEQQMQGLMHRPSLAPGSGMLFVFGYDDQHTFWMKNTLIPLDGIWISSTGTIVDIIPMIPCTTEQCATYKPVTSARYVLEVKG